jgi:hypothetical protein
MRQRHIAKNIYHNITKNNAIISQADEGKTTVIIYKQDYEDEVCTFLADNNFHTLPNNPTKRDQTRLMKTLQQCNLILHRKQIRHLTQKNPSPPTLKAQLKLHKLGIPIMLVVNSRSSPSYKAAKKLSEILKQHLHLNNHYTTDNSTNLAYNLTKLTINNNYRLLTLDVKDVNIPIRELLTLVKPNC